MAIPAPAPRLSAGRLFMTALVFVLAALGANSSLIDVDWMIGSAEMDIDGITAAGTAEPLMRRGEWV